jgi:hypothetical protein
MEDIVSQDTSAWPHCSVYVIWLACELIPPRTNSPMNYMFIASISIINSSADKLRGQTQAFHIPYPLLRSPTQPNIMRNTKR